MSLSLNAPRAFIIRSNVLMFYSGCFLLSIPGLPKSLTFCYLPHYALLFTSKYIIAFPNSTYVHVLCSFQLEFLLFSNLSRIIVVQTPHCSMLLCASLAWGWDCRKPLSCEPMNGQPSSPR